MPDPVTTSFGLWDAAKWLLGVVAGLLGYVWHRQQGELEDLRDRMTLIERSTQTIAASAADRAEIKAELREHRQETRDGLADIVLRINALSDRVQGR